MNYPITITVKGCSVSLEGARAAYIAALCDRGLPSWAKGSPAAWVKYMTGAEDVEKTRAIGDILEARRRPETMVGQTFDKEAIYCFLYGATPAEAAKAFEDGREAGLLVGGPS